MSGDSTWYSVYICENKNCRTDQYNALNTQLVQQKPCPSCGNVSSPTRARVSRKKMRYFIDIIYKSKVFHALIKLS